MNSPRHPLSALLLCGLLLLVMNAPAQAGSAAWNLNPTSGDWNTADNWTPNTVPNGPADTATFDVSNTSAVAVSANIEVDSIVFEPDASAFTVTVPVRFTLNISGTGIMNNSSVTQNFVTEPTTTNEPGTIEFSQNASAGGSVSIANNGGIGGSMGGLTSFIGSTTAGTATIINNGSTVNTALGGLTQFFEQSNAAEGSFIMNGGTSSLAPGGRIHFFGNSSAGAGNFTVNGGTRTGGQGGSLQFYDSSTAGSFLDNHAGLKIETGHPNASRSTRSCSCIRFTAP